MQLTHREACKDVGVVTVLVPVVATLSALAVATLIQAQQDLPFTGDCTT